jgi:DNA-binding CsgD family transcriptional regulator
MAGYTFTDKQLSGLRDVIDAGRLPSPDTALPWPLLETAAELIGCDYADFHGVDYRTGHNYFSQDHGDGQPSFRADFDKEAETGFWSLVHASPHIQPWIPEVNESAVIKPTDFMSVRQLRELPVYIDGWSATGKAATYLMSLQRQLRLLFWRHEARRDFNERERFVLQLLLPHIEAAYRAAARTRSMPSLTPRQRQLMSLLRNGYTNYQMSRRLDLSEGTVRTHLNNIYERLDVGSRTEAVTRWYLEDFRRAAANMSAPPSTASRDRLAAVPSVADEETASG